MNTNKLQAWVDDILAKQTPTEPAVIVRGIDPQVWKDLQRAMRKGAIPEAINVRVA